MKDQANEESNILEEWASLWQENLSSTHAMRQDFMRRSNKRRWAVAMQMIFLFACLGGLVYLLMTRHSPIDLAINSTALVIWLFSFVTSCKYESRRETTPPLTPHHYLDLSVKNLLTERDHIRWAQHYLWPMLVVFVSGVLVLLLMRIPLDRALKITFLLATPGMTLTWWVMFKYAPNKLDREHERLRHFQEEWGVHSGARDDAHTP